MSTLTIEDFTVNTELDKVAMRAIQGGRHASMVIPSWDPYIANSEPSTRAIDHVDAQRTNFIIVSPYVR